MRAGRPPPALPRDLLDLAGNDYLGLLRRPDVVAGAVAAAQAYGGGAGASRLVTGTLALHEELELGLVAPARGPTARWSSRPATPPTSARSPR